MVEKLLCKVKDGVVDGTMVERQDVASYEANNQVVGRCKCGHCT